jgi:tetratricopeptide (TPR) repeat protein/tRNA A-37 threonylcarbamoyl transferase component Bud32
MGAIVRLVRIGTYEVLGELGRGGMGVVYKVRTKDGREAALKLLTTMDQATFARFERERRLLAALGEAEGFVGLLDGGTSAEGAWLVMPFVPGGTLRQRLERGPLGVAETVTVGTELARALGAAHARGIVHRDVKPENILFTASGRPLLADLGLAKHFDSFADGGSKSVLLTVRGAFKGTAGYMAPEQIGDSGTVGPPADVFALGAVLHECLSGQPAFGGVSLVEVLSRLGSGTVEPLRDVPSWLEEVVRRALAHDPRARFADGTAFAEAFRTGAGKASQGKIARPEGRRRRALVPLVAGATLGGLVLAVALGVVAPRGVEKPLPHKPPGILRTKPDAPSPQGNEESRSATELQGLDAEKLGKGELETALASTIRAIELHPTNPIAWLNRAGVRDRMGDLDRAISDATRAIELAPNFAVAWAKRGAFRAKKSDWDGDIADETRAIALDPAFVTAWVNRGAARGNKGDWDGDIADQTRAIELAPNFALAWANRGAARGRKGEFDRSIADETRAIELNPSLALAWQNRGVARANKGDFDGELADVTRAIEVDPNLVAALVQRGMAWMRRGDWDSAIAEETRAIELDPTRAVAWANRGGAKAKRGDIQGAVSDMERALALGLEEPDAEQVRTNLAAVKKLLR